MSYVPFGGELSTARTFCNQFSQRKLLYFEFTSQLFQGFNVLQGSAGLNNGLAPNRRETAKWWRHQKMETFCALLAICAGNHRWSVNSPHKGQWREALMFSLICTRINGWVNSFVAGDLGRHRPIMTFFLWSETRTVQFTSSYMCHLTWMSSVNYTGCSPLSWYRHIIIFYLSKTNEIAWGKHVLICKYHWQLDHVLQSVIILSNHLHTDRLLDALLSVFDTNDERNDTFL